MDIVFDKNWFKREQNRLLWLLNHSTYFRKDLGIQECDLPHNVPITEITPNSFSWGDRYFERDGKWYLERTTDFRGTDKFARRMYYAFYPVWNIAHKFDLNIANRFAPTLNLGFDTLTKVPGSIGSNNPVDGNINRSVAEETFASILSGAGNQNNKTSSDYGMYLAAGTTSPKFTENHRIIMCFDTSSLTSGATISAATISLYSKYLHNSLGGTPSLDIVSSNPASTTTLANGDYSNLGSTSFSNVTYDNFGIGGYRDFSLNANGISNVSKTSISLFGVKLGWDTAGTFSGTWASGGDTDMSFYSAKYSGREPKLVVTYSVASAHFLTSLGVGK